MNASSTQANLFRGLRWRLLRNNFNALQREAPVRLLTIFLCSLIVWGGTFAASVMGFRFVSQQFSLFGVIVNILFDMLYLALSVLLIFSTGLILYSSLFRSTETEFLLGTPAAADQVFAYKFHGALAFSSWAFVLLASPTLIAYGLISDVPWYFYAFLPLFFLGFILLPGAVGALLCLIVVNCFPRRPRQVIGIAVVVVLASLVAWGYQILESATRTEIVNRDGLQRLLGQFNFVRGSLSPPHWMAQGLQAAAAGKLEQVFYYLALIWSNGLFFYVLMTLAASFLYRRAYNRVATGGFQRKRFGGIWLDNLSSFAMRLFAGPQVRLLIIKDLRTFRRDPAQWAQVLIFTGLFSLYLINVRKLFREDYLRLDQYHVSPSQSGISLLNLMATALLLCAYTGRFVFPMLSLEGRKFWILGLLPLRRERILWGKFVFSTIGGILISWSLVLLSDIMLGLPGLVIALHSLTILVVAAGLSGLSVGLGAWIPNFKESDPSKIAASTGGTLNLVAGLVFILAELALMTLPWHLAAARNNEPLWYEWESLVPLVPGVLGGLLVGVAAVVGPLGLGARALRKMEF